MFIRPVRPDDLDAVHALAQTAGIGMTSLPADVDVLQAKIDHAHRSFQQEEDVKGKEAFLFVMEDSLSNVVAGTTGIKAHVGLNQPFYSYKLTTITQQSRELGLLSEHKVLHVNNDLTGHSEIGSLFLRAQYRRDRLGRLLSLCRFLFIADYPQFFADTIIAEMRGVHLPGGDSPFYDSIARHFFEMEFARADYINATQGNEFISDLMPKYPIYTSLLPKSARDVLGQPHPNSEAAKAMLEHEGFRWQGYIDIFDGGPTLMVDKSHLRTLRESRVVTLVDLVETVESEKHLVSNRQFADFRCAAARLIEPEPQQIVLEARVAEWLNVGIGDSVRIRSHHIAVE